MANGISRPTTLIDLRCSPVLGTDLSVRISAGPEGATPLATKIAGVFEADLLHEIDRLETVFSVFRPEGNLARWRSGDDKAPSDELGELLRYAYYFHHLSFGTFNPLCGLATKLWAQAAKTQAKPTEVQLLQAVAGLRDIGFSVGPDGTPIRSSGSENLVLNAIAKGYIVDKAAAFALEWPGISVIEAPSVVINIGGDLVHVGSGHHAVEIENPAMPFDNAEPLLSIDISNAAVGTSGSSKRGWLIEGRWFSHVIDPRTAHPVDHVTSATVVANTALEADALATAFSVLSPHERTDFVESLEGSDHNPLIEYVIVADDGTVEQYRTPD